jgi:hypothetical protein
VSGPFEAKVVGEEVVRKNLTRFVLKAPIVGERVLRGEGELIKTASMRETPVGRGYPGAGALRASHYVESKIGSGGPEATIGVGGPSMPYALAVHEHPSAHDPPSWQGATGSGRSGAFSGSVQFRQGGPKFLEKAAMAAMPGMPVRMAKAMKVGMGFKF